jgi:tetratricopeptide (TPR) repeat protein
VGEAYVPPPVTRRPFPTPSTSGRTTYARRFDGGLKTGGAATSTAGGTLGRNGAGSVTSAIEALRRSNTTTPRVRAPQSPGARFRSAELDSAITSRPLPAPSAKTPATSDIRKRLSAREAKHDDATARRRARYDIKEAKANARKRRLLDPNAGKLVSTASGALATATGALVSTATRPLLGGVPLVTTATGGTDFGGYGTGTGGSDFDGYGSPFGPTPSPYGYVPSFGYWDNYGYYHSPYSSWWGWSFGWASSWGFYLGYNWGSPYYSPLSPYGYYCPSSYYYPTVINHYIYEDDYDDDDGVVVNVYQDGPVGEAVYADDSDTIINIYPDAVEADGDVEVNWLTGSTLPAGTSTAAATATTAQAAPAAGTLGPAAMRYLELGDSAFSEMRFADAVHFYARSLEFEPDRGMLHLVLADALFATGDWHFAAYSIRKALQLEPDLVDSPVDKHQFYADPAEFDRQLASLELYFEEHPTDGDARLVLALNQLFGGRPEAAKDLLENAPTQAYGETDHATALILASADRARWGQN